MQIKLKYGLNPNQKLARVTHPDDPGPLTVLNGAPSYINMLDALRGWQLVRELAAALAKPAAASFKHVSPAGAAVAGELSETFRKAFFIAPDAELSPIATAYAKARSSDRVASFGDFIAVSDRVDATLAQLIKPEVSDGIIAPAYDDDARAILAAKKGGGYVMLQIDPAYTPAGVESRTEFGLTLEQDANTAVIDRKLLGHIATQNAELPDDAAESLLVATITLKHTQSNSIAVAYAGQAVGIGAGQQSRIACTRLACDKFDRWALTQHPKAIDLQFKEGIPRSERVNIVDTLLRWYELTAAERETLMEKLVKPPEPITAEERVDWLKQYEGVALSSDAFFPFRDNLDRAARSGVRYVAQAGGSKRDEDVVAAADEHAMVMAMTGLRLFLH